MPSDEIGRLRNCEGLLLASNALMFKDPMLSGVQSLGLDILG